MDDDELLFGWDEDRRWVWADDDDGWVLDLPATAAELIDRAARPDGSDGIGDDAVLEVADGGLRPRRFRRRQLAELVEAGRAALRDVTTTPEADDDRLAELAQGAAVLATVLDAVGQPGDPDAAPEADRSLEVAALARLCQECDVTPRLQVQPRRDGTFRLRWRRADVAAIEAACDDLRRVLESHVADGDAARLYPTVHPDDPERNHEWVSLTRDELTDRRLAALTTAREALSQASCDEAALLALVQTLNSIRLVEGTRLGIVDDDDVPRIRRRDRAAVERFDAIAMVQYEIVEALRTVPPG